MAGTDADDQNEGESSSILDLFGDEPDSIDAPEDTVDPLADIDGDPEGSDDLDSHQKAEEDDEGILDRLSRRLRRGSATDDAEDVAEPVEENGDESDGPGLAKRVVENARERLEDEETGPEVAELVDGATVYFIDPAARSKSLPEYGLVVIDAAQYPEPVILKNDVPIEIPEGSVLCSAESVTIMELGGKRVVSRPCILVPPSRAHEVAKEHRVEVPDAMVGKTIPQRENQSEQFYRLVLSGTQGSEK